MNGEKLTTWFEFLDDLRLSGATNMFGSAKYLAEEYGMDDKTASNVVGLWMKTFSEADISNRVETALKAAK